ncbi:hypothetical protein Q673_06340 [Marinobacter sp. EN3]|nr:hypothetical protein Q673_06340 [Marinobacter sp. EN3]
MSAQVRESTPEPSGLLDPRIALFGVVFNCQYSDSASVASDDRANLDQLQLALIRLKDVFFKCARNRSNKV